MILIYIFFFLPLIFKKHRHVISTCYEVGPFREVSYIDNSQFLMKKT